MAGQQGGGGSKDRLRAEGSLHWDVSLAAHPHFYQNPHVHCPSTRQSPQASVRPAKGAEPVGPEPSHGGCATLPASENSWDLKRNGLLPPRSCGSKMRKPWVAQGFSGPRLPCPTRCPLCCVLAAVPDQLLALQCFKVKSSKRHCLLWQQG